MNSSEEKVADLGADEGVSATPEQTHQSEKLEPCFQVHRAVWKDDLDFVKQWLDSHPADLDATDLQGNTPLLLAVILGREQLVKFLISKGADIRVRGRDGFRAFDHALFFSNWEILKMMYREHLAYLVNTAVERLPLILEKMEGIPDFEMKFKWVFHSWIPLLARIFPHDEHTVWKRGRSLRFDTTLSDFKGLRWIRGDNSFIFRGSDETPRLWLVDRTKKVKYPIFPKTLDDLMGGDWEEDLKNLYSSPAIVDNVMTVANVKFVQKKGWFGYQKTELVANKWKANLYELKDLEYCQTLLSKSEEVTKEQIAVVEKELAGKDPPVEEGDDEEEGDGDGDGEEGDEQDMGNLDKWVVGADEVEEQKFVASLSKEEKKEREKWLASQDEETKKEQEELMAFKYPKFGKGKMIEIDYGEYFEDEDEDWDQARGLDNTEEKEKDGASETDPRPEGGPQADKLQYHEPVSHSKIFKANLAMSPEFPLSVEQLLPIFEILAPTTSIFEKFKEFLDLGLPSEAGFPVKADIPLLGPAFGVVLTIADWKEANPDESLFEIPEDFEAKSNEERRRKRRRRGKKPEKSSVSASSEKAEETPKE